MRSDQVADLVKADRLQRLNEVVNAVAEERAQRFMGRELEVLVEGPNPRNPSLEAVGRTRHNKVTFFPTGSIDPISLRGQLVTVRIKEVRAYTLYGTLADV